MSEVQEPVVEEVPVEEETQQKKKRGRPRKIPLEDLPPKNPRGRPRVENPSTSGHPKDPECHKKYYQNKLKGVTINCPKCDASTYKLNLTNHMKSDRCARASLYSTVLSQLQQIQSVIDSI